MGTNYYVKSETCESCGHKPEQLHIGKLSAGWEFVFQATEKFKSFEQWCDHLKTVDIVNEYDEIVTYVELVRIMQNSSGKKNHHDFCVGEQFAGTFKDVDGWAFNESEFS